MMPYLQKFQGDAPLLPFTATHSNCVVAEIDAEIHKAKWNASRKQSSKNCQVNAMQTGIHVVPSDVDVEFAATATLTKAYKERKLSQQQVSRKSVVQCWQLFLPKYRKEAH